MTTDLATHLSEPNSPTKPGASWPTETGGLPAALTPKPIELGDGEQFDVRIAAVTKTLGTASVRMLAYNGSIPGPTLRVQQGSSVVINAINDGDLEATVHWHGLRWFQRSGAFEQTRTWWASASVWRRTSTASRTKHWHSWLR